MVLAPPQKLNIKYELSYQSTTRLKYTDTFDQLLITHQWTSTVDNMRRTYFRTRDWRHFRLRDWRHFRSRHVRSLPVMRNGPILRTILRKWKLSCAHILLMWSYYTQDILKHKKTSKMKKYTLNFLYLWEDTTGNILQHWSDINRRTKTITRVYQNFTVFKAQSISNHENTLSLFLYSWENNEQY